MCDSIGKHPYGRTGLPNMVSDCSAYQNFAIIGNDDKGTPSFIGDKFLLKSIDILHSVREEGKDKAEWSMRMAYGYQYLTHEEEKMGKPF